MCPARYLHAGACEPSTLRDNAALPDPGYLRTTQYPLGHPDKHPPRPRRSLPLRRLPLHLLRNLNIHLEKLGHAAVQTHRLPLVEVGFAVLGGNAFACAGVY